MIANYQPDGISLDLDDLDEVDDVDEWPSAWACGRSSASYSWNRLILGVEASYRWTNLEFDDDDIDIEGDLDQLLVGGFIAIRI